MANRDIRDLGDKTAKRADQIADFYYQRDERTKELLPKFMRQLILYTELLNKAGETIPDFIPRMQEWGGKLGDLTKAVEEDDGVLIADRLHYEIVPALQDWVKASK